MSDFRRPPTTVEHLVDEYERDVREVDAAHLEEYARLVMNEAGEGQEFQEYLGRLAQRSIHVHAWSEEHFFAVLHHAGPVTAAAFSPDGRRVATGAQDGVLRVWDLVLRLTNDRSPLELPVVACHYVSDSPNRLSEIDRSDADQVLAKLTRAAG